MGNTVSGGGLKKKTNKVVAKMTQRDQTSLFYEHHRVTIQFNFSMKTSYTLHVICESPPQQ